MVQLQTDKRDPAERGVACKPAKFLDLFRKLPMQRVVLACSKTGMGPKSDGVRGASLPLVELLLLLLSAAPSGSAPLPGYLHPWSLQDGRRWCQVTQGSH